MADIITDFPSQNSDIKAFALKMKERHVIRQQKSKERVLAENPITQVNVPETEKIRGYTYFEQKFDENSAIPDWDKLIKEGLSVPAEQAGDNAIIAVLEDGILRWSKDAPAHSLLIKDQKATYNPFPYPRLDIKLSSKSNPESGIKPGHILVNIFGPAADAVIVKKLATYIKRNISGHDNDDLMVTLQSQKLSTKGSSMPMLMRPVYIGPLGKY